MRRLALLWLLGGCTVGPSYQAPIAPSPAVWSTSTPATTPRDLTRWWNRAGDPVLVALIEAAMAGNPGVDESRARLREARAVAMQEGARDWPEISASASAERRAGATGTTLPGRSAARTQNSLSAGFDMGYEIDLFGGQRRAIESAEASAEAAEADLRATQLTLLGDVARNYAEARGAEARRHLARETLAAYRDSAGLVRARARGGLASELDAVRAEAEAEKAAATLPPLEVERAAAVQRLAVLTGSMPATTSAALAAPAPVPDFTGPIIPMPPAAMLARRPDVARAERRLAAATAAIGVAEAQRYPAISLAGALGVNAARLSGATIANVQSWSFGPSLDLPIFDAGRRRAVVSERAAQRDQRLAAWRAVVLEAVEEAENGFSAVYQEERRHAALRRTVAAYASSLRLARTQYVAGLASFLDVLDAQRSLSAARDELVQSETRRATSAIALYKALGGGWENP